MGLKSTLAPFQRAAYAGDREGVRAAVDLNFAPHTDVKMCHPFGDMDAMGFVAEALAPLWAAIPDAERRDLIVLEGVTPQGDAWVGCMGNYIGTFRAPFLDIPPTGQIVHMRYHEFFRVAEGRVVEAQIIWDLPELMMQAGAWPMGPQLGGFLCTPAPASQDGLVAEGDVAPAMDIVVGMLTDLCKYPVNPDPGVMNLDRYWHPQMNWYGPAGIGTARGIAGFRHWHQAPFLRGMPDRKLDSMGDLMSHWFGQGDYVCETGWPNMRLTVSGDGWLGIAPSGTEVLMRSLDFWRVEDGLIRENWVLVDLLDVWRQLGVDVLARMRAFNRMRVPGSVPPLDWREA